MLGLPSEDGLVGTTTSYPNERMSDGEHDRQCVRINKLTKALLSRRPSTIDSPVGPVPPKTMTIGRLGIVRYDWILMAQGCRVMRVMQHLCRDTSPFIQLEPDADKAHARYGRECSEKKKA